MKKPELRLMTGIDAALTGIAPEPCELDETGTPLAFQRQKHIGDMTVGKYAVTEASLLRARDKNTVYYVRDKTAAHMDLPPTNCLLTGDGYFGNGTSHDLTHDINLLNIRRADIRRNPMDPNDVRVFDQIFRTFMDYEGVFPVKGLYDGQA